MAETKTETKRFTFGDGLEPPPPPIDPPEMEDDKRDFWEAYFEDEGIFAGRDQ